MNLLFGPAWPDISVYLLLVSVNKYEVLSKNQTRSSVMKNLNHHEICICSDNYYELVLALLAY